MSILNLLLCLYPIGFIIVFLFHAKLETGTTFREEFWSLQDAKIMEGMAAIFIILHHLTQYVTDYGATEKGFITGMNSVGILFTSIFFFFSGYGLFVSYQTKKGYLEQFLRRRLPPVLIPFMLTNLIYTFTLGASSGRIQGARNLFTSILGFTLINTNAWFIVEILILYMAFYMIFRKCKNDKQGILWMTLLVCVMIAGSLLLKHDTSQINGHWFMGEWWYNTTILFVVGMAFANWKKPIVEFLKRHYTKLFVLLMVLFVGLFLIEEVFLFFWGYYCEWKNYSGYGEKTISLLLQILVCICFVLIWLMINMKCRFENRMLRFLSSISLEVFLIHDIFRIYIGIYFKMPEVIFFFVVLLCSGVAAKLLWLVDGFLVSFWGEYIKTRDYIRTNGYADVSFEKRQKINRILQGGRIILVIYGILMLGATVLCGIKWYEVHIIPKQEYKEERQLLSGIKMGDEYLFGRFELDLKNYKAEQIPWIVLEVQEDRALLVSRYVLGPGAYNQQHQGTEWYYSSIRVTLNDDFYEEVFSEDERKMIVEEETTGDKVFLLSAEQASSYFKDDNSRITTASEAAKAWGTNVNGKNKNTWWWLWDSDVKNISASVVTAEGTVDKEGTFVNCASGGIRPAIWISLK